MTISTEPRDFTRWPLKPWQIASLRQALGKTQIEFAKLLSADPSTVGRWESGRSRPRQIYIRMIIRLMESRQHL